MNQKDALTRLNKEKEYEDWIAKTLLEYYLVSIDSISDLTDGEKKKIKAVLSTIAHDSQGHSENFSMLINFVLENGEIKY